MTGPSDPELMDKFAALYDRIEGVLSEDERWTLIHVRVIIMHYESRMAGESEDKPRD